ncbi:hypothetical protein GQ457_09G029840 [Hibiscus cannabinus]
MAVTVKLLSTALLLLSCSVGVTLAAIRCPDCGSTAIPYPLSTGPACGDQNYKIRCDGGSLVFDTLNNSYPITSINGLNQRLVIQPASLVPNTCVTTDLPFGGVLLNSSLPFNITSSNTVMFLNCTSSILQSPLSCSATGLCHVYINGSSRATACEAAPICCTFVAGGGATAHAIRARETGCRAYTSFVNLQSSLPVNRWPEPGMELQWISPPEPICGTQADCDGNSTCGTDPNSNGVRRCFCNSGLFWDPIQGVCSANITCQNPDGCGGSDRTALIAGLTAGLGTALVAAIIGILLYRRHMRIVEAQECLRKEREAILNSNNGGKAAKAIDFNRDSDDVNLAIYVKRLADKEKLVDIIDPILIEKASLLEIDTMKALGFLALSCLEERRQNRPSMKEITEEIEYIICIASGKAVEN